MSLFLRLLKNVSFALINWNEILHLSWLKTCLQTVQWTVKMETTICQREISTGHLTDIRKDWGTYRGLVLLCACQFFHDLFKSSMTHGKLSLLKNVQNYPFYGISDLTQVNRHKLWYPLKCVPCAIFARENSRRHQWFPRVEMTRETSLEILWW